MSKHIPKFTLKLTAAIVIDGEIRKAGELVEVDKSLAENLLYRGRAELVETDDEGEAVDLSKMKKPELVALATEYGIDNPDALNVDQLRAAIKEAAAE
ncbi:putative exonuclease, terminase endonuclease subunit [Acinetobacter phage vB_AbaP_Alexa]|nr:putative exonuclease, terminase endonuclease subunit [Acinetobacter phage vB_AbaP_Alexa]